MIRILLLAAVPFMTQHRNVVPKTEVSTNFYGSVTGVVTTAYIQERSSIELPEKWALANVTNANGKSVRASDVGALGNSGSQTLNQSYNGLSVTFDAKGALYTGQYAPSRWSITKEANDQYYYVQFFGFNGTNYPSFNLFDGESDFYISLPRKEGTLALQSDVESKADKTTPYAAGNFAALTADGNLADSGKNASDFAPAVDGGYLPVNGGLVSGAATILGDFYVGPHGDILGVTHDAGYLYNYEGIKWYYGFRDDANEIAVKGDISATNPTFSNAVLAVQISTNDFAALYALKEAFADLPIDPVTGGISIGALLAALASAVAWLKKNKVGSFASVGGATATVDNGVAKLDDFFTESNSLLMGTIDARLPYPLYAVPSAGLLKDRAINTTSLDAVTVPDNFTDLLVRASVSSSLSVTMPEEIATKYGDTFPGEAGEYLITITKTDAAEAYVRTIKLEEVANA